MVTFGVYADPSTRHAGKQGNNVGGCLRATRLGYYNATQKVLRLTELESLEGLLWQKPASSQSYRHGVVIRSEEISLSLERLRPFHPTLRYSFDIFAFASFLVCISPVRGLAVEDECRMPA
jgi:hypothetical protein